MFNLRANWIKLLLILVIPVALLGGYAVETDPNIGFICEKDEIPARCRVYTAEFNAQVYFKASGIYHHVDTEEGRVFFMQLDNASLLRLIFYCKDGKLVTVRDQGEGTFSGYEFCTTVPFQDGAWIQVDGTLVSPSAWDPALSTPSLRFIGDLYVFEMMKPTTAVAP